MNDPLETAEAVQAFAALSHLPEVSHKKIMLALGQIHQKEVEVDCHPDGLPKLNEVYRIAPSLN